MILKKKQILIVFNICLFFILVPCCAAANVNNENTYDAYSDYDISVSPNEDSVYLEVGDIEEVNLSCGANAAYRILNNVSNDGFDLSKFSEKDTQMNNAKDISSFLNKNGFKNKIIRNARLEDLEPGKSIILTSKPGTCTSINDNPNSDAICNSNNGHFWVYEGTEQNKDGTQTIVNDMTGEYTYNENDFKKEFTQYALIPGNKEVDKSKIVTNIKEQEILTGFAKQVSKKSSKTRRMFK